jgi:hypothetical protein
MSTGTLTTLAVVRDGGPPSRADVGKAPPAEPAEPAKPATIGDLLQTMVPTSVVAAYTAAVATLVAHIEPMTSENPHPDQFLGWRWGLFAIMVAFAVGLTVSGYHLKKPAGSGRSLPVLETLGALTVAAGWGLAVPQSPLVAQFHDPDSAWLVPLVVGFGTLAIGSVIANFLKQPA